jgi:hypothetical protein
LVDKEMEKQIKREHDKLERDLKARKAKLKNQAEVKKI